MLLRSHRGPTASGPTLDGCINDGTLSLSPSITEHEFVSEPTAQGEVVTAQGEVVAIGR